MEETIKLLKAYKKRKCSAQEAEEIHKAFLTIGKDAEMIQEYYETPATFEEIASAYYCDISTVFRHRRKIIDKLAIILFYDNGKEGGTLKNGK